MTLALLSNRTETEATMATEALARRHKRMIEEYWAERGATGSCPKLVFEGG